MTFNGHSGPDFRDFIAGVIEAKRARSYIEIGVRDGALFTRVACPSIGIDPDFRFTHDPVGRKQACHLYRMTSDAFFRSHDPRAILGVEADVVFVDGMHLVEYALRDFMYAEANCARHSVILLDDCLPVNTEMTEREFRPESRRDAERAGWWTGDVWKMLPILREYRPDLRVTPVATTPTGTLCVTNLDPASTVLRDRYYEILDRFCPIVMDEALFRSFYADLRPVDGVKALQNFGASLIVGP